MQDDFIKLYKASAKASLGALGVLLLLLVLTRISVLGFLSDRFVGGSQGDAGLYLWLAENSFFLDAKYPWFYTNAFYPYGLSLAWSDNFILPTLCIRLLTSLSLSFPLSWNIIIFGASLLTGYSMFSLLFRLTNDYWLSIGGGALLQHYGFLALHMGHPQLQFLFFIPLGVIAALDAANKRSIKFGVGLGLIVSAAFLSSVYYSIFLAFTIFVLALGLLLVRPGAFSRSEALRIIAGGVLGVAPIAPIIFHYLAVKNEVGERGLHEAFGFAANSFSYIAAPPLSTLYSWTSKWSHTEAMLFPGLVVLIGGILGASRLVETKRLLLPGVLALFLFAALVLVSGSEVLFPNYSIVIHYAAAGISWLFLPSLLYLIYRLGALERKLNLKVVSARDISALFVLLAALSFLISLGPLGYPEENTIGLGVFRVFYELFPGIDGIRAISRIGILSAFSLIALLVLWFSNVQKRFPFLKPFFLLLLSFGILENHVHTFPVEGDREPPQIFSKLSSKVLPGNSVLVLPMTNEILPSGGVARWGDFARRNVDYMRWSYPLMAVNGYSGIRTRILNEFPSLLERFPDRRSIDAIRKVSGLRYIVYLGSSLTSFDKEKFLKECASFPHVSVLEKEGSNDIILEISGERRIDEGAILAVPPIKGGTLKLSLKVPYEKDSPDRDVRVFGKDPKVLVLEFKLKANGEWSEASIQIPETDHKVKPLSLIFQTSGDSPLYSKDEKYFFPE